MNPRRVADFHLHLMLLAGAVLICAWSLINPRDWTTWCLEATPAIVTGILLVATYRRFTFSNLAYWLILFHAALLLIGGHYTYAEMPLFSWLRDVFGWQRNNFDRVGHVMQGVVPAIIVRELLLRTSPLRRGKWLITLTLACCLAISAAYELLEWAAAMGLGQGADQFLATQGDVWDTQWDMALAFISAVASLLLLSKIHDRSLMHRLPSQSTP